MRLRRFTALVGTALLVAACISLYLTMDLTLFPGGDGPVSSDMQRNKWLHFEGKLKELEEDIRRNHETVGEIRAAIGSLVVVKGKGEDQLLPEHEDEVEEDFPGGRGAGAGENADGEEVVGALVPIPQVGICAANPEIPPKTDIQMLDVYKNLKFDNPDGGAWKQGWKVEYPRGHWDSRSARPLKVFVVPHSHNDPGWIRTFEEYFSTQTRKILNNVAGVGSTPGGRFVWAEISFLDLWWQGASPEDKERIKSAVNKGILEIVTGGWVMTDEATAHYYSMLTQLTEGHLWLERNLHIKPKNGWSIDPFGVSPTMAYLLKRSGIKNMLIQRVHYSVKKHFAREKTLEFLWRQAWDSSGHTDILTHMMPFYSYDVPHTCGPDPRICCQFDFKRLPGTGVTCPWRGSRAQPITADNVAQKSWLLLDQYRKKSVLFRTERKPGAGGGVVLAPLGDDFRYDLSSEWQAQFSNYRMIFDYLNTALNLNVQVQFGTLDEYFTALRSEMGEAEEEEDDGLSKRQPNLSPTAPSSTFPTLTGDFFTYADRDDHYWSGFYTSRPFYKRMDRVLMAYLRAAEIMFSMALGARGRQVRRPDVPTPAPTPPSLLLPLSSPSSPVARLLSPEWGLLPRLRTARRWHSLFQHHDGVTGTAKDHVVNDYAQKMLEAISGTQHVIQQCAHYLLTSPDVPYRPMPEQVFFSLDDTRRHHHSLPEKTPLDLGGVGREEIEEGNGVGGEWAGGGGRVGKTKKVVLFNPLAWRRKTVIWLRVNTPYAIVKDWRGDQVVSQSGPVFEGNGGAVGMVDGTYDLWFLADVPPLALASYFVTGLPSMAESNPYHTLSKVRLVGVTSSQVHLSRGFESTEIVGVGGEEEFSIASDRVSAAFGASGFLKALTLKDGIDSLTTPVHIDFARYGARPGTERSGAYLFLPDGEAEVLLPGKGTASAIRVLQGPLISSVTAFLMPPLLQHTVSLWNIPGVEGMGLEVTNIVNISGRSNFELVMRISTSIRNKAELFTDLNGFQMLRRRRLPRLPLQGNYYPLPSLAFIEDSSVRFSLLSAQSLGVASLKEGQIEVMQDRRLDQDDNRGLGQGVLDNIPTPTLFRLILEKRKKGCKGPPPEHPTGFPSVGVHLALSSLLHPPLRLIWLAPDSPVNRGPGHADADNGRGADGMAAGLAGVSVMETPEEEEEGGAWVEERVRASFEPVRSTPTCDFHLVNLRVLSESVLSEKRPHGVGMVLHRLHADSCFRAPWDANDVAPCSQESTGQLKVGDLFPTLFGDSLEPHSLTFITSTGPAIDKRTPISVCPMELSAYVLDLSTQR
ncbi:alpha-mannosidase 2 [Ischnura elegans]|uniref:alpha-mannosidase 2 n=1 Tax=Ischnura elegans TaxID=197161 RepID=UPI001ED88BE0|nr:alpha-mannosidase 2 [Ischnura elegans]